MELLRRKLAALACMCFTIVMLWRHSLIEHKHFFDPSPGLGLELWRDASLALRWEPCWGPGTGVMEETSGYIIVVCSGGLNQMRRDFCKGVGIARLLNATLLLPRFDVAPFWNDSSGFADIFDVEFFLESVRNWVDVQRALPARLSHRSPVEITYHKTRTGVDYLESLLPQLKRDKVILLRPHARQRPDRETSAARSARCHACYRSLRLTNRLQGMADAVLHRLPRPFVALHLRFEPDMVAYSRCRYGHLSNASVAAIARVRGSRDVLGETWRRRGKCPLTPQETVFLLTALRVPNFTVIYLAAGSELLEAEALTATYSRVFQKPAFLDQLQGVSRAAIDWFVSLHADAYIATFVGNMDKMVVADRMMAGRHRNLVLDRRAFAEGKWQGMRNMELSELMLKNHRLRVTSGAGLPMSDCICSAAST